MLKFANRRLSKTVLFSATLLGGTVANFASEPGQLFGASIAIAADSTQATTSNEQRAFDAAKELGTVEAWDAFLKNYPTGFNADLARAYVKKLAEPDASSVPTNPAPLSAQFAIELPCREAETLSSYASDTPTKITFVNQSNKRRIIEWIDFKGNRKEYANLAPGDDIQLDTYLTHPWIAREETGACSQAFMPSNATTVALLNKPDTAASRAERPVAKPQPQPQPRPQALAKPKQEPSSKSSFISKSAKRNASKNCIELGLVLKNGSCVSTKKSDIARLKKQKKKGCPAGTYLNPLGVCQPNETGS